MVKKAHFNVDCPNMITLEFTQARFRLLIHGKNRIEAAINLQIQDLLRTRFDFGGGFQGIISDLYMFINR